MDGNKDLDDLLREVGKNVEDVGRMLAKRRRKNTPYDRFTLEELTDLRKSLKFSADTINNVAKLYKHRAL